MHFGIALVHLELYIALMYSKLFNIALALFGIALVYIFQIALVLFHIALVKIFSDCLGDV